MGLFSNLFDNRMKVSYGDGCGTLFLSLYLKTGGLVLPQHYNDISDEDYQTTIVGYAIAYIETLPKQPRASIGPDIISNGGAALMEDIANRDCPKIKESYLIAKDFIKSELQGVVQEAGVHKMAENICNAFAISNDVIRQKNLIIADLRMMFENANTVYSSIKMG